MNAHYSPFADLGQMRYLIGVMWALNNMTVDCKRFSKQIEEYRNVLKSILKCPGWEKLLSIKERVRAILLAYFYKFYVYIIKIMNKHYT